MSGQRWSWWSRSRRARAGGVAAGVVAALAVWAVAVATVDDLRQPSFGDGSGQGVGSSLGPGMVLAVSALGGLAAWAALAIFERTVSHPRRLWLAVCATGLVASLGGPFSGSDVSSGNRIALAAMHLAVAAVVLPLLYRTTTEPAPHSEAPTGQTAADAVRPEAEVHS